MPPRPITPGELAPPLGLYSHGMRAPAGEIVVVSGQVGMDAAGRLAPGDARAQTRQTFANIEKILAAAGATMRDVVRFQTFLTSAADIEHFMEVRRELFPRYYPDEAYPPNTILVVTRLVQPELLVEIEAMAVKAAPAGRGPGGRRPAAARGRPPRGTRARGKMAARRR